MEVDDSTNTFHRKIAERRDRSSSPVDASGRPPEKRRDLFEERVEDSAGDTPPGSIPPLSSFPPIPQASAVVSASAQLPSTGCFFDCNWGEYQKRVEAASFEDLTRLYREFDNIPPGQEGWIDGLNFFEKRAQRSEDTRFFEFMRWAEQDEKQAIGAYLFFPREIEVLLNLDGEALYRRPLVQRKLAISAFYGNPIAQHHLAKMFAIYANEDDPEDFFVVHSQTLAGKANSKFREYIGDSSVGNGDVSMISKEHPSNFYRGIFSLYLKDRERALRFFQEDRRKNPRSAFEETELDPKTSEEIYRELERKLDRIPSIIAGKVRIYYAQKKETLPERLNAFLEVGEADFPEGFYLAALMPSNIVVDRLGSAYPGMSPQLISASLFEEAGKRGMVVAYGNAADLWSTNREPKPVEEVLAKLEDLYGKMKDQGDASGYADLGKIYEKRGELEKAREAYKKAGLFDPSLNDEAFLRHYTFLYDLAETGKIE